jgi:hypothetical protein
MVQVGGRAELIAVATSVVLDEALKKILGANDYLWVYLSHQPTASRIFSQA